MAQKPESAFMDAQSTKTYTFRHKIGGTTYEVQAFFKEAAEPLEEKILRMVKNDLSTGRKGSENKTENVEKTGFQNGVACGMMSLPQMSRSA